MLQHQRQPEYTEAVQQHKIIVNSYWLLACVETKHMLPVDDLVGQWLSHTSCFRFVLAIQAFACVQFLILSVYLQLHCPFSSSKIQGASGMASLQGTFICGSLVVHVPVSE